MGVIDDRVHNIDALKLDHFDQGDTFGCDYARLGPMLGAPTGGPESAHQIINDSNAELAYLSISTMMAAEICEYPDSNKVGAFAKGMRHMTRREHHLDYWADET